MLQKLAIIGEIGFSKVLDKGALFLFELEMVPMYKEKCFSHCGVEELQRAAQRPDLNPIQHRWDELRHRLRARPHHWTSVADLTDAPGRKYLQVWKALSQAAY